MSNRHSTDATSPLSPLLSHPASSLPPVLQKYLCAATAASIAETATMPLDVCKTRMQLDTSDTRRGKPSFNTAESSYTPSTSLRPRGLISTGRQIYAEEGARALYIGLTPAVLRQALVGGIGVGLYPSIKDFFVHLQIGRETNQSMMESIKSFVPSSNPTVSPSFGTKVVAGATSGIIGQLIAAPTCVVKVRLQADARLPVPRYTGTIDAFLTIPRTEGLSALWRGIVPSLQRAAVMYGATISTYDHVKHAIVEKYHKNDSKAMDYVSTHVLSSSVSGLVASLVSTPFDTIKTRIISQTVLPKKSILGAASLSTSSASASAAALANATSSAVSSVASSVPSPSPIHFSGPPTAALYSSTFDCVLKTVRTEGFLAIYKGLVPCYARLAPWQLIFFVSFEQLSIVMTGQSLR